ncbi:PepSY-associated TM helix domain-containing protein [Campylobacter curvus]|uniref:PepSY-associated TM helix domain-containing protein n=1 Tax=Campylobacter curvus TaxID=200 RepID=UPI0003605DCC|nr:PepSY-associated TM helix domain-containing protein [Campylobacter curvus]QKF62108.1 putative iron-regulated membrane protein [Campylobacter curvus]UEB50397.1 PepSY domain-containing protein [Campylobacter curvus]
MLLKRNKIIFNIHLLLGLIAALPLLIMTLSAPFVSYRAQIADLINESSVNLPKSDKPDLKMSEILTKFKGQTNFQTLNSIQTGGDNTAYRISVTNNGKILNYFVDPRSGEVIGEDNGENFKRIVLSLHRNLGLALINDNISANIGKQIVAVSSIIMSLLMISGIWLYAPLIKKNFKEALKFNLKAKGYALFYKLHASLGLWVSVALIVMPLTGLYWSYGWVRSSVNAAFGVKMVPKKMPPKNQAPTQISKFQEIDKTMEIFVAGTEGNFTALTINVPDANSTIYSISYSPKESQKIGSLKIDTTTGEIKERKLLTKDDLVPQGKKFSQKVLRVHTGEFLGKLGQVLFAFICLIGASLFLTGFLMMFKRINKR